MGEISEMMLDGTLCQQCGVYMGGTCDYPRTCGSCKRDARHEVERVKGQEKVPCATCGKEVKRAGLIDHMRDAHGVPDTRMTARKRAALKGEAK